MRWILLVLLACGSTPQTAPAKPARYTGPIIDVHAHFLTKDEQLSFTANEPAGLDHLRGRDREAGVTRSALIVMAKQGDIAATRALNDGVIAAAAGSNGAFFAVASVHPADGQDALDELTRVAGRGVRVIKLHPNTQRFDVGAPEVTAVVARCAELRLVILFDGFSPFDANQNGKFLMLAVTNPKARMILAHMGGARFDEMAMFGMVRRFAWYPKNLWFDLSATSHTYADSPYEDQLVWVARQIGTDRILFGSDYPVDTPAHAVDDVHRLGFNADEERQIFHDNAAQLLAP
jgi:predicted TIM-barrel fold metal-dependent hydrolase